jgi:hypothetical protein
LLATWNAAVEVSASEVRAEAGQARPWLKCTVQLRGRVQGEKRLRTVPRRVRPPRRSFMRDDARSR